MGSIASLDALVAKMSDTTYADNLWFSRTGRSAGGAATSPPVACGEMSQWLLEGQPGSGATVTSLAYPTNVTRGAMKQVDPSGGRQKWLTGASMVELDAGTFILYDRLAHVGGLSGTSTSNQSVSSTITRYTNGIGNQLWVEIQGQIGTNDVTFHFDYTDENNASATTPEYQIGKANYLNTQRLLRAPLAAVAGVGGRGVKNMTNFKLSSSTGTAGDICAVIAHPLMMITCAAAAIGDCHSWIQGHLPVEILPGACLAWVYVPNGTSLAGEFGSLHMIEA